MALDPAWRQTPAAIQLGKLLFDKKSQASIQNNPALIVSLLKAAGFTVPKELVVTADVAQVIMSGGAFVTAVQTANDINSIMSPTAAMIRASVSLLEVTGAMDPKSPAAQILTLGTDIAMVYSAGGMNVLADLSLVLDATLIFNSFQNKATINAYKNLQSAYRDREKKQASAAARNFADYHNNKLDVFSFIGKIAEESPDYFESYFPEFGSFIPQTTYTLSASGSATAWWGSHKSYTASMNIKTIVNDHKTITTAIVAKYAGGAMGYFKSIYQNYKNIDSYTGFQPGLGHEYPLQNRISLGDMCALSLIPPYFQNIPPDFDIGPLLKTLRLSPSDFDDQAMPEAIANPWYFPDALQVMEFSPVQFYPSGGLTKTQVTPLKNTQNQKNMINWDDDRDIDSLMNDYKGKAILKEWGTIPRFNTTKWTAPPPLYRQFYGNNFSPNAFNTIKISQLWTCLSYLKIMENSQFFKGFDFDIVDIPGLRDQIETKHKELYFKSIARLMNQMALLNISQFLNIPVNKLKKVQGVGNLAAFEAA